jgi:hypothetical protein
VAVAAHPWPAHNNLAAVEADQSLSRAPAVASALSPSAMAVSGEPLRVIAQHLLQRSDAGRQTKRSNELSTSCQAASRLGASVIGEGVVVFVMALLSFADSSPRA